jgi:hypothetical protein
MAVEVTGRAGSCIAADADTGPRSLGVGGVMLPCNLRIILCEHAIQMLLHFVL